MTNIFFNTYIYYNYYSIKYIKKRMLTVNRCLKRLSHLIGIGKAAHTREDTENVIIDRIYADNTVNA